MGYGVDRLFFKLGRIVVCFYFRRNDLVERERERINNEGGGRGKC